MNRILKYPIIFFACFCISAGIIYFTVIQFTTSAEEVILPEFREKNILYVLETLTQMGLNAKLEGTLNDESVPRYGVISQDPLPGTTLKKGRDVMIVISKGRSETIVPDLRRLPLAQALIQLEKNEFKTGHLSHTWSSQVLKDEVISQYPQPFASANKQTGFNLLISRGPKPLSRVMPDFTGHSFLSAQIRIEDNGLKIFQVKSAFNPDKPMDVILSQTPLPGAKINSDSDIFLVINQNIDHKIMAFENQDRLYYLQFNLEPGFRKRHVRVETDLFGQAVDLYNKFVTPGQVVTLLVFAVEKNDVNLYIDQKLERTITIDPWKKRVVTGENTWELLPPPFYQQILQDLEMN